MLLIEIHTIFTVLQVSSSLILHQVSQHTQYKYPETAISGVVNETQMQLTHVLYFRTIQHIKHNNMASILALPFSTCFKLPKDPDPD